MENTIENKLKFFGLYAGQDVLILNENFEFSDSNSQRLTYTNLRRIEEVIKAGRTINDLKLYLKPIQSVSQKDGKYWHENTFPKFYNFKSIVINESRNIWAIDEFVNKDGSIQNGLKILYINSSENIQGNIEIADYLRSKGYALPYMDLSIQQLIHFGWIELIKK